MGYDPYMGTDVPRHWWPYLALFIFIIFIGHPLYEQKACFSPSGDVTDDDTYDDDTCDDDMGDGDVGDDDSFHWDFDPWADDDSGNRDVRSSSGFSSRYT